MPAQLGFPKTARLRRRAEYLAVKASGKSFADGPLAASWRPSSAPARVGLTVSSKVGGAVIRNRVKRRLREAVRHEFSVLPQVELVVVARQSSVNASVEDFRRWLRRAAERIRRA